MPVPSFPEAPLGLGRYPWEEWLDGGIWKLKQGEDFQAKLQTFRSNAGTQAKKRGGKLRTRTLKEEDGEYLVIWFQNGDDSAQQRS